MANTKSAIKRIRTSEKRRQRNRAVRTRVRTALTTAGAEAGSAVLQAIRTLDKAVTKGVIHRNTAARKKSALARKLGAPRA